jgi:DNA-binding response OmpR family regulator
VTQVDGGTILIVEDDRAVSRTLRVALMLQGFDVRVAYHGEEALADVEAVMPAAVLLDLEMPVMDGRAFYREFRQRGHDAPVIILSAWNAERARTELGAQGSMDKPFDPDAVGRLLTTVLQPDPD